MWLRRGMNRDVVRRWLIITRIKRSGSPDIVEPSAKRMAAKLHKPGREQESRRRLFDTSASVKQEGGGSDFI